MAVGIAVGRVWSQVAGVAVDRGQLEAAPEPSGGWPAPLSRGGAGGDVRAGGVDGYPDRARGDGQ